ncbi:MAG: DoxX family protein, partial [Acidimicrobiia bacterium]
MCRVDSHTPIRGGFDVEDDQVDVVVLIGRVLFALIAVGSAFGGHFMATDSTAGYAESRGVKNPRAMVLISGVLLVAAAVSLIAGIYADLGALLFGSFTLLTAFMIHHFWTDDDEMTKQIEMTNFMKNLSITGGA